MTSEEIFSAYKVLQQARQAFGQQIDMSNEFAVRAELSELEKLSKRFPEFSLSDFETAIRNTWERKKEVREKVVDTGGYAGNVRIEVSDVGHQCNAIQAVKNSQKAQVPQIEAPTPIIRKGSDWLLNDFPYIWENSKTYGMATFPPIWSPELWADSSQMEAITAALKANPEFHAGRRTIAMQEASNDFVSDLMDEMRLQGLPNALILHTPGSDYNLPENRAALRSRIDEYNANKAKKLEFATEAVYRRITRIVAVKTYGRLIDALKSTETSKESRAKSANPIKIVTNLNEL